MEYYNVFLTVFSNNGCRSLTEEITINTTFPEHVAELDGIKVYPNPVQDILNVELIHSKIFFLQHIRRVIRLL